MLAEHGMMARDYPDVRANTVASFALGDYEWILAFEADELHRIVDLMRHLARLGGASPRPRGGALLHGPPQACGGILVATLLASVLWRVRNVSSTSEACPTRHKSEGDGPVGGSTRDATHRDVRNPSSRYSGPVTTKPKSA